MKKQTPGLFGRIEKLQAERAWGDILDAGTGDHSARWISRLDCRSWTAVTASSPMADEVRQATTGFMRGGDRIVVGNWLDPTLLEGDSFDTLLVDYLIGAIDGFAPYWQTRVFDRLRPLVRGRIYVTGVEPYVPFPSNTEAGGLVREIGCLRDACLLLAGERPYREYPLDWVLQHLDRAGFRIVHARHHPIIYRRRFVDSQLAMCRERVRRFHAEAPAESMLRYIDDLQARALSVLEREDGLRHGADYLVAAEPVD